LCLKPLFIGMMVGGAVSVWLYALGAILIGHSQLCCVVPAMLAETVLFNTITDIGARAYQAIVIETV